MARSSLDGPTKMFLTTHSRAPSKWSYLFLAFGFMMLGVGPVGAARSAGFLSLVLLTMHARVKPLTGRVVNDTVIDA
jgi:hypothetical protein